MDSINKLNKINTDSIVADRSSVKQDKNEKQNPISPHSGDLAVSGGQASPRKINKAISDRLFPFQTFLQNSS